ncbi:MAG: reverse transcriptase/maturase family protein [Paludibacter sp.]|nr:reverse transcriptase/maturase family protein [Paludibacter sp.]
MAKQLEINFDNTPNDFRSVVDELFTFEKFITYFKATTSSEKKKSKVAFLVTFYDDLFNKLSTGTWQPMPYNCFFVKDPKPREIFAPNFDDRIVHHLLVDILSPIDRRFIYDSYANRKGKGTHKAIYRTQDMMRKFKNGGWYLQCDIQSYFVSINKKILFNIVMKHLDSLAFSVQKRKFVEYLLEKIIWQNVTHNPVFTGDKTLLKQIPKHKSLFGQKNGIGLPIGSLTSQFFSLIYLNELDQFVKHRLKIKQYVRYVDDFVIIEEDPLKFSYYIDEIGHFLQNNLSLSLHPNKIKIQQSTKGLNFLGYIVRPWSLLVRRRTVSNFKNKLAFFNLLLGEDMNKKKIQTSYETLKISHFYKKGLMEISCSPSPYILKTILQTINSYYGIFGFANSYNLRISLYENHFGALQRFFAPKDLCRAFSIKEDVLTEGRFNS